MKDKLKPHLVRAGREQEGLKMLMLLYFFTLEVAA
jgi:hypothetical protein